MGILLLGGSPAAPSSSSRLLLHVGERLALHGHRNSKLFVRDLPPRALLHADSDDRAIRRALLDVASADAIVIATPVYQASFSGVLKAFLDLLPQGGLAGKLVLPLATGGSQSHMLALDYALRPVLQALEARQVLGSVYATAQQLQWKEEGGLTLDASVAWRIGKAVDELSSALHALRQRADPAFVHAPQPQPLRLAQ